MGIFKKLSELIFGKEEVSDVGVHYDPFYVDSLSSVDEANKYYVFNVTPPLSVVKGLSNHGRYYELHIKTIDFTIYYEEFIGDYIHVELMDNNTMEIYEGEFYQECTSNGPFRYALFELKEIMKSERVVWKAEYD